MSTRSLLAFVSALAIASAGPLRKPCSSLSSSTSTAVASPTSTGATTTAIVTTPTIPLSGDATELPVPTGALQRIAVGHGIQNYTCTAAGANATSGGALAVLYDITNVYSTLTEAQWAAIPVNLLYGTDIPLNLVGNAINEYAADIANPFKPDVDVTVEGVSEPLSVLGHHFFDAGLLPTFDLYASDLFFKGGKLNGIKAPATADVGLLNTGAVDWLQLGDKGTSVGVTQTYRVVTAGGNPVACTSANETFSVPYTAQYWFYS